MLTWFMFDYLTKFKKLPKELQEVVSSAETLGAVKELEKKYGVDLAALVIKVMVKEVHWAGLVDFLIAEHNLERNEAQNLRQELAQRVFSQVSRYLGIAGAQTQTSKFQAQSFKPQVTKQDLPPTARRAEEPKKSALTVDDLAAGIMPQAIKLLGIERQVEQQAKLKSVLTTFVKGIRDFISAREALMKEPKNGGLGLSKEQAESALNLVTKNKSGAGVKAAFPQTKAAPPAWEKMRDMEYDFSALTKNQADKQTSAPLEQKPTEMLALKPDATVKITLPAPLPAAAPAEKASHQIQVAAKEKESKPAVSEFKESMLMRRRADKVEPDRPRLDDIVKPPSRLQGPIEELANLDLVNFRRLGGSPEVMASKIQNKIKLLEQESFTKRQQGISAWRHSPLYQLYIAVGQKALTSNKSVNDALQENSASADALTSEEFEAILELNRQLRV